MCYSSISFHTQTTQIEYISEFKKSLELNISPLSLHSLSLVIWCWCMVIFLFFESCSIELEKTILIII